MSDPEVHQEGFRSEYNLLMEAMAKALTMQIVRDGGEGKGTMSPKHLRRGMDSALLSHAALVKLLVIKGVFTGDEYAAALVETMREKVADYEAELGVRFVTYEED